jgi:murein DD-endopeptidase MepM/ murein hydrolase activator NlpD
MRKYLSVLFLAGVFALPQGVVGQHSPNGGAGSGTPVADLPARLSSSVSAAGFRMKLPFPENQSYEVFQGVGGAFSHGGLNRFAWDFGLPEDTPVCAVAQGRIVRVKQDSDSGGLSSDKYAKGNTIIVDHGNGIFTQYLHLRKNSARVVEGEVVDGGQVIARSGNTGYSSTPHLHFQVQDATGLSIPAVFLDIPGTGIPVAGQRYTSGNDGTGMSRYVSESPLPLEAFLRNGIVLEFSNLPGHLLSIDGSYRIRGNATTTVQKVVVYVMGPQGGRALISSFAKVNGRGEFECDLSLRGLRKRAEAWSTELSQSNIFTLAIAPVEENGSFWSTFSVPVTVR